MRFLAAVLPLALVLGFGETPYAGLTREQAERLARDAAAAFPQVHDEAVPYPRRARVLETGESHDSRGRAAWLTIFRFVGEGEHDPDQACVWVRATPVGPWGPYEYETAPTIAHGRTEPVHERCLVEADRRGYIEPEQTVGNESEPEPLGDPEPMSPFGRVARGTYVSEWIPATTLIADHPLLAVVSTAAGTWGFSGYVVDEDTDEPVPRAIVTVAPATPASILAPPARPPDGAVTTVGDELGAFAFIHMPVAPWGWDIYTSAPGYPPQPPRHDDDFAPGETYIGNVFVSRTPR